MMEKMQPPECTCRQVLTVVVDGYRMYLLTGTLQFGNCLNSHKYSTCQQVHGKTKYSVYMLAGT